MKAKEMFEKIGYKFNGFDKEFDYIKYSIIDKEEILFWIDKKEISIYHYIVVCGILQKWDRNLTLNELNAINQQCKELGWKK